MNWQLTFYSKEYLELLSFHAVGSSAILPRNAMDLFWQSSRTKRAEEYSSIIMHLPVPCTSGSMDWIGCGKRESVKFGGSVMGGSSPARQSDEVSVSLDPPATHAGNLTSISQHMQEV